MPRIQVKLSYTVRPTNPAIVAEPYSNEQFDPLDHIDVQLTPTEGDYWRGIKWSQTLFIEY